MLFLCSSGIAVPTFVCQQGLTVPPQELVRQEDGNKLVEIYFGPSGLSPLLRSHHVKKKSLLYLEPSLLRLNGSL
jgi:hypothetical protein